jgi:hypothetical protein
MYEKIKEVLQGIGKDEEWLFSLLMKYLEKKEKNRQYHNEYYAKNKEKLDAYHKQYRVTNPKYRRKNIERAMNE